MAFQQKTYSPRRQGGTKNEKQQSPYDVLFNLIFLMNHAKTDARQKAKKRGSYYSAASQTNLTGLMSNVAEIGLQPAVFPYKLMIDNLSKQINDLTEIKTDTSRDPRFGTSNARLSFGISSIFQMIGNPRAFVDQGVSKFKAERDFAVMGGRITRGIDGAIFALWAKEVGASTHDAAAIGHLYGDDLHPDFLKESKQNLYERVISVSSSSVAIENGIDKDVVRDAIAQSYNIKDKAARKSAFDKALENAGVDEQIRKTAANNIYGVDKQIPTNGQAPNPNEKEEFGIWVDLDDDRNLYDLRKIGQNRALADLSARIAAKDPKDISFRERIILKKLQDLTSGKKSTLGTAAGRALVNYQFIKTGIVDGEFGKNLLQGRFDKLKISKANNYKVYFGSEPELGPDGKQKVVSIMEGEDGVMGHLLGSAYYLHPVNMFNGLFVNGELWLKMAKKRGPGGVYINAKSPAYFIYNMMPRQLLAPFKAKMQNLFSKMIGKIITQSVKTALKTALKSALSFVIGGIPGAGLIIQFLFDKIIDEAANLLLQIGIFVLLALAGYVIMTMSSLTVYIDQLKPDQAVVTNNVEISTVRN